MKKYLSFFLMFAMCIIGCKKSDPAVQDSISVSPLKIEAPWQGDSYSLTVTASGDFTSTPDVSWITVKGTSVTVSANDTYEIRSGAIAFRCGEAAVTVQVSQESAPEPKSYTELDGPANSYIVGEAGDYKIKATVKGNGDAGLHPSFPLTSSAISPAGAKLVWEESDGLVTDVELQDGYICFSVPKAVDGNALVAATDAEGTILWSWHIWSTEAVPTVAIPDTPWELMDRNLGAFGNSAADGEDAFGMYYQWGRKDPFSRIIGFEGSEYSYICSEEGAGEDNTVAYSIAHPDEYITNATDGDNGDWLDTESNNWLWGSDAKDAGVWNDHVTSFKSVFDPCPKGYRVASMWAYNVAYGSFANADGGFTINNGTLFFPNCSFIYCAGHGWWDPYATVWTDQSAAWGGNESKEAFRAVPGDAHMNYPRGYGQPVRCMKHAE